MKITEAVETLAVSLEVSSLGPKASIGYVVQSPPKMSVRQAYRNLRAPLVDHYTESSSVVSPPPTRRRSTGTIRIRA